MAEARFFLSRVPICDEMNHSPDWNVGGPCWCQGATYHVSLFVLASPTAEALVDTSPYLMEV